MTESAAAAPAVTAAALRRAFIAGARRVIAARDELNRINVFPVPDGDTGSNLSSTLGHVLQGAGDAGGGQVAKLDLADHPDPEAVAAGALAGSAVQNSVGGGSVRDIYRVSVKMRDGSVRAFDYQQPPQLNIGEYVRVDGNQIYRQ